MSKLLLSALIAAFCWGQVPPTNDLANSKWSGTVHAPDPVACVFAFSDNQFVCSVENAVLESMTYETKGDTLKIKKISGGSPCGEEVGLYKFSINDNVLKLDPIQDACEARPYSFSPDGYERLKE
ncbi:hypothetical protein GCM10027275_14870 [Rhabdobacter roseus]|uniref:Uncharacterized protein n=1 Tax=Rhabdobacter roseus TaxID=1655419 RepID=A0A840TNS6_9BACT|nr:hypothetical protein [Rhabdobacter roseus]MBB5283407.1 hypothetical protein [Rhabdobacter roseus]